MPEEEKIIQAMERYEGRKFPEVTEEQMESTRQKLLEWDADEWPVDEIVEAVKVGLPGNGSSLYVGPNQKINRQKGRFSKRIAERRKKWRD